MDGEIWEITRVLREQKRSGCTLLVLGSVCDAHHELCQRLLGEQGDAPRYRLLVLLDRMDCPAAQREHNGNNYHVIDHRPVVQCGGVGMHAPPVDIETLQVETLTAIEEIDIPEDEFKSAELRVCVNSLEPLLDYYGTDELRPFLGALTDRIRKANGMAQFHLPLERDSERVEALIPMFDIVVELRDGEYRWEFPAEEILTEWVPLSRG